MSVGHFFFFFLIYVSVEGKTNAPPANPVMYYHSALLVLWSFVNPKETAKKLRMPPSAGQSVTMTHKQKRPE